MILDQAGRDLASEDADYQLAGLECCCKRRHYGKGSQCPTQQPFRIMPAKKWIEACSVDEWGFAWIVTELRRYFPDLPDPEVAMEAMLALPTGDDAGRPKHNRWSG
ncbi:hypothetical protein LCGC14_2543640 [marine sediment metagenome]|uniref:Uncharacterized protein n=1 Tax=marine sediment metagenome TaxID=412755 RepID=A0A0F9D1H7_9ZZZZ